MFLLHPHFWAITNNAPVTLFHTFAGANAEEFLQGMYLKTELGYV